VFHFSLYFFIDFILGLQCAQQFTGINFIFYFGTSFFQTLGTISNPFLISLVTTLVNVLSTPISFYIIERFGRRRILLLGGSSMVVCQFIVAIIGTAAPHAQVPGGNPTAVKAEIAFICLNIASFATTWGPAAWVVVGEMFPLPIRSRGVGMSTASNWCVPFLYFFLPTYRSQVLELHHRRHHALLRLRRQAQSRAEGVLHLGLDRRPLHPLRILLRLRDEGPLPRAG
jgi:MFS family permease